MYYLKNIFFGTDIIMILDYHKLPAVVIKYLIIGCVIFGMIVFIPCNKLGIRDSIILSIILTLSLAIIENVSTIMTNPQTEKFDSVIPVANSVVKPVVQSDVKPIGQPIVNSTEVKPQLATPEIKQDTTTTVKVDTTVVKSNEVKPTTSTLYKDAPHGEDKEATGTRADDDVITTDLPYSDDAHHLPLPDNYNISSFEYGDSFLPPEKWYPTPPFPPVCVSEKRCPVCPVYTIGTPIDVKEWHEAGKIMPPAGINTKFIKERLNAGR